MILQPGTQRSDKRFAIDRQTNMHSILLHPAGVLLGRHELRAIITERVAPFDIEITRFELQPNLRKEAEFKVALVNLWHERCPARASRDQRPPFLRDPGD